MESLIEATLQKLIHNSPLAEPVRYALLAPAKRVRPKMVLAIVELLGGDVSKSLIPACAIECLHTYSLIHDDLPCMDDDDFRRGLPSLHRAFDEATAVLSGDYLLSFSFQTLADCVLESEKKLRLISELGRASEDLLIGQTLDLAACEDVDLLHQKKTAALFRLSSTFGAILGDADRESEEKFTHFGEEFGMLFQLVDDLKDEDHPLGEKRAQEQALLRYESCLRWLEVFPASSTLRSLVENVPNSVSRSIFPKSSQV